MKYIIKFIEKLNKKKKKIKEQLMADLKNVLEKNTIQGARGKRLSDFVKQGLSRL